MQTSGGGGKKRPKFCLHHTYMTPMERFETSHSPSVVEGGEEGWHGQRGDLHLNLPLLETGLLLHRTGISATLPTYQVGRSATQIDLLFKHRMRARYEKIKWGS